MEYKQKYLKYKHKYLELKGGIKKFNVGDIVEGNNFNSKARIEEVLGDGYTYNLREINETRTIHRNIAEQELKDFKIENPEDKKIKDKEKLYPDLDLSDWDFIAITGNFRGILTPFTIYRHKFNDDRTRPNLVVMSGFSDNSVRESGYVIKDKLPVLSKKYKSVFIINLSPFKKPQNEACNIRDVFILTPSEKAEFSTLKDPEEKKAFLSKPDLKERCRQKSKTDLTHREQKNSEEIQVYKDASVTIRELLSKLELENVHLLGECAGGGLAIYTVNKHPRYTALFLAVPSSPLNIGVLSDEVLKRVKFRFSWNINDEVQYDWHKEEMENKNSFDEKNVYDASMKNIMKTKQFPIDYVSFMFSQDPLTTKANNRAPAHEIHRKFIDYIVNE
jgi:hypothetical protein